MPSYQSPFLVLELMVGKKPLPRDTGLESHTGYQSLFSLGSPKYQFTPQLEANRWVGCELAALGEIKSRAMLIMIPTTP